MFSQRQEIRIVQKEMQLQVWWQKPNSDSSWVGTASSQVKYKIQVLQQKEEDGQERPDFQIRNAERKQTQVQTEPDGTFLNNQIPLFEKVGVDIQELQDTVGAGENRKCCR